MCEFKCNYCGIDAVDFPNHDCVDELMKQLTALREQTRWIPVEERLPEWTEYLPGEYCADRWTGNEYETYGCEYFCKCEYEGRYIFGIILYNFERERWEKHLEDGNVLTDMKVLCWAHLPPPPEQ